VPQYLAIPGFNSSGAQSGTLTSWSSLARSSRPLLPASANPVLQLRRIEDSSFEGYRRSFDVAWETAIPIAEYKREQRQSLDG